ncbi:MAG: hypothetical protein AB1452_00560 [Pseudomonadota bacterium]
MSDEKKADVVELEGFRLEGRLAAPELFVEGWTHFYLGYPTTKILFHSVVEPPSPTRKETRRAQVTIAMPLGVAIQLAQTILAACKTNESVVAQASEQMAKQIKQVLSTISNAQMPPGLIESDLQKPEKRSP